MFLGHPYLLPGTTPNMFFILRVTPDQWCVFTLGIDTRKSASTTGLIVGNLGTKNCSTLTKTALESFWAYVAFIMNSLIFLLIGLEIHVDALLRSWRAVLLTVAAVLVGRASSVYLLAPVSNVLTEKIPIRWQHVIVWGGLRGALALALALSLDSTFPYRDRILDLTFGIVVFSILVQGLTMKPLLRALSLANGQG
jgi:CPA1 family monovalent cation:H+ antiporter